ncbi:hypothetical protein J9253_00975 [Thiothrix litoralis]|jgi:hypothetical protein|uniref:Uncharacterized protein n=1 Tax=Thiothrix litoralis TaxID=2891210 RepID=A0ABX7WS95_9GAMM|nr:hypothetical protein [Thiothrix litoralis]QTR46564.1 hypothetical protein J9253_00975 [Thiothrix litoralis]
MIDASVLVNPVNSGDLGMQQLPAPTAQDVKRFEDVMTYGDLSIDPAQDVKEPILSIVEPSGESFGGFKQALLNKVQGMDSSYHSVLSEFQGMPEMRQHMVADRATVDTTAQIRTYPETATMNNQSGQMETAAQSVADNILSAAEYQNKVYQWASKMEMWFSHMKIISSAVGQVSQGFKTLFQAG